MNEAECAGTTRGWPWISVLILTIACAGCGHAEADSAGEPVPSTFAADAVTVCAAAADQMDEQGPFPYPSFNPTDPDWDRYPGVADYLAQTPPLFKAWEHQMRALGQPSTGVRAWNHLLDAIHAHVALSEEQHRSAVDHDSTTFTRDFQAGRTTQDALKQAADAAGVPSCADPDR
jgi:hypothetical protein